MMAGYITNYRQLADSEAKRLALDIAEAGIDGILPETVIPKNVSFDRRKRILTVQNQSFDASKGKIYVIGGGKGTSKIAEVIEGIIGPENIEWGIVNDNNPHG